MMSNLSKESLESWKIAFAKSGIKYGTDDKYREAVFNLVGYVETLIDIDQQQKTALEKMKAQKEPKN